MADHLDVAADLHLEIDGIDAHLSGSGSRLHLQVDQPVGVYRRLRHTPDLGRPRESVAVVAQHLDAAGLTIDVVNGDTRIFSIGAGQASRVGGIVTGTRLVSPGRLRPVTLLLATAAVTRLRTWRQRRR